MKKIIKTNHKVSIVMPSYNSQKYINESIKSVLNQTYKNWELIIVDDNSNDDTTSIVKEFKDTRIKLIELIENVGAGKARNIGIKNSTGRYVAFVDSDDLWMPNKLKTQLKFMIENDYSFTFTAYKYIHNNKIFKAPKMISYKKSLKGNDIGCLTVILDRYRIKDIYMPEIRKGQDHLTWLKILKNGNYAYGLNKVLSLYRKVQGSLSTNKFIALKRQWKNYRIYLGLPFFKAIYYYCFYIINGLKKYIKM